MSKNSKHTKPRNPRPPSTAELPTNGVPYLTYKHGSPSAADEYVAYVERMKPIFFKDFPRIAHITTTGSYQLPTAPEQPTRDQTANDPLAVQLYFHQLKKHEHIMDEIEKEKPAAYSLLWGSLSTESRAKLQQRGDFAAMESSMDPLLLWTAIKEAHVVAASGSAVYDRSRAREHYGALRQGSGESLAAFKQRTDTALASMKAAGATMPTDQEQATDFISRLDPARFSQLFVTLRNNEALGIGRYPTNLTAAYDLASEFMVPLLGARGGPSAAPQGAVFAVAADSSTAAGNKGTRRGKRGGKGSAAKAGAGQSSSLTQSAKSGYAGAETAKGGGKGKSNKRPCPPGRKCPICLDTNAGHWPSDCPWLKKAHDAGLFDKLLKQDKGRGDDRVAVCHESCPGYEEQLAQLELGENVYTTFPSSLPPDSASTPAESPAATERGHPGALLPYQQSPEVVAAACNGKLSRTDLLLDNQASVSVVHNLGLLTNLRDADVPISITGIGGRLLVTKVGTLQYFGDAYYHRSATANVISFSSAIASGADIEFVRGANKFVWRTNGQIFEFRPKAGLYVCNLAAHRGATVHVVSTVAENEAQFTKREVAAARLARRLTAQLGYISDADLIRTLQSGGILNCPVTVQDVQRARAIYGPDLASLKGKTTWKRPPVTRIEHAPRPLAAEQTLHADIMFVEGEPYLVTVSDPLDLTMVTPLSSRSHEALLKHVTEQIGAYQGRQYVVRALMSDGEGGIKAIAANLQAKGIAVECKAPESHDGVVERKIRVLKERVRAHLAVLPFALPAMLLPYLVLYCTSRINMMPSSKRVDVISPREAFLGRKPDYKRDLYQFGAYAQATKPLDAVKNSMAERTEGVIVLLPTGTVEGSVRCFCLKTKRVVTRPSVTVLPMPPEVIDYINQLADSGKRKVGKDPIFRLRDAEITDEEPAPEPAPVAAPLPAQPVAPLLAPAVDFVPATLPAQLPDPPAPTMSQQPALQSAESDRRGATVDDPSARRGGVTAQPADPVNEAAAAASPSTPSATRSAHPAAHNQQSTPPRTHGMQLRQNPRKRVFHTYLEHGLHELVRVKHEFGYNLTASKALQKFSNKALSSIVAEVLQMDDKKVFEPVLYDTLDRAQMKAIIRSSLFLKEKVLPNGQFDKLKARLVASGNMQDKTLYEDISSPTIATTSAMMLCAIAAKQGREVVTIDIAGAYLNAPMKEKEVLMRIDSLIAGILVKFHPERYARFLRPDGSMVVRLLKALYGCVESARLWYEHLSATFRKHGFTQNQLDPCVFNRNFGDKQCTIGVHVDDVLATCEDTAALEEVVQLLQQEYQTITIHRGKVHNYLGMTLDFTERGKAKVTMTGYIKDALEQYGVTGTAATPAAEYLFKTRESPALDAQRREEFHSRVAKLLFLAKRVRPDILTTIAFLATRVNVATEDDWQKLDRVLRYLNATPDLGIVLQIGDRFLVVVYADASFDVHADSKSHTGITVCVGAGPVYVKSSKQKLVSKSSTEAELIALSDCATQAIWTRNFLLEQGHDVGPVLIFQDNKSTIALAEKGAPCSERTRHIHMRYFWIKDRIEAKEITVHYLPTREMVADLLTKPLQGTLFRELRRLLLNWE